MSQQQEINCLKKLNDETSCFTEIVTYLANEKVISQICKQELTTCLQRDLPFLIYKAINQAIKEEKLQLVDYHWQLLPEEKIRITIITNMTHRDFTWNH